MKLKKFKIWSQSDYEHLDWVYVYISLNRSDLFLREDFIRKHLSFFVFHTQQGVCRQDQSVFYSSEQTNLRQTPKKKRSTEPPPPRSPPEPAVLHFLCSLEAFKIMSQRVHTTSNQMISFSPLSHLRSKESLRECRVLRL